MVEPTRICSKCKERKPWSAFYAKKRWEDGTVRQPQSWCKVCQDSRPLNRESRKRANKRYWAQYKANDAQYGDHLERRRFRYHIAQGRSEPMRRRSERCSRLPAAPFAAWITYVLERDDASIEATAARLGMADRLCRRIRDLEQQMVSLETVERALIADGTIGLEDLYPDLNLEAA